jgi:site-specific recombinase XerD
LPAALGPDLTAAVDLAKAEKAVSTRKAYGTDFRLFKEWCETKGIAFLPASPETVAAFLAAETGNGTKPSTLARRVAATLRGYVRDAELFKDHAGEGLL